MTTECDITVLNATPVAVEPLSEREERFALSYAVSGNASAAYLETQDGADKLPNLSVRVAAHRLTDLPRIQRRVSELRTVAARASTMTIEELIADLELQLRGEPVSELRVYGCRSCATGRYQYKDELEYAVACGAFQASLTTPTPLRAPPPLTDVGFNPQAPVNPQCGECLGAGVPVTIYHDHATLSRGARSLIKGVSTKRGDIVVETESKLAIRRLLHELRGDIVKRSDVRHQAVPYTPPARDVTPEEALAALEGLRK